MKRFGRLMTVALCAGAVSGGALAQTRVLNRAEVQVTARTDASNAAGYCSIDFLLRNVGSARLSVFAPEIVVTDMRTGAALTVPTTTITFSGIEPGATRELTNFGAHGARCEHVRLQVTGVTCMVRCESVAWTQRGLGAFEAAL